MALRIIMVGNQKGGSGKSTTAIHVALGLAQLGKRVASLDIDAGQNTMTRFLANRSTYAEKHRLTLPITDHRLLSPSDRDSVEDAARETEARFDEAIDELGDEADYLVVDGPAGDTVLSRYAHSHADVLVTPINDSFIDLDGLAEIDPDSYAVVRPSRYAAMVWEQKKRRAARDGGAIDWIVMRNRLAHLDAHNKRRIESALAVLAPRVGFRLLPGFAERVIYRELFPRGLTVLDLGVAGIRMTMSHVGARNEIRTLLGAVMREVRAARPKVDAAAGSGRERANL